MIKATKAGSAVTLAMALLTCPSSGCNPHSLPTNVRSIDEAPTTSCPKWECGTGGSVFSSSRQSRRLLDEYACSNAPSGAVIDGQLFHELDGSGKEANRILDAGVPQQPGLSVTRFERADKEPLALVVDGDQLTGITSTGDVVSGRALIDSRLWLTDSTGVAYYIRVDDVGSVGTFVDDTTVPSLRLVYRRVDATITTEAPLCTDPIGPEWAGLAGQAFIFTGDRYDEIAKTVTVGPTPWFNIACAGTSYARMHLSRYTTAGSDAAHVSTQSQRQAMFKMLYADYCGGGRSFSFEDTPIRFADANGWIPLDLASRAGSIEAIWNADGAVCLDHPRLESVPGVACAIEGACPTSTCESYFKDGLDGVIAHWQLLGDFISAN
jgi:hypothetical protein